MGIHRIMPALPVLLLASLALEVSGHGGMVWPPIWQDGHYTSLNKITGYKIYSDPKVKDPNTGLSIADARAWLTDQAYIGGHGDNFKTTGEVTPTACVSCPRRARPASPRSALQRMCLSLRSRRP